MILPTVRMSHPGTAQVAVHALASSSTFVIDCVQISPLRLRTGAEMTLTMVHMFYPGTGQVAVYMLVFMH